MMKWACSHVKVGSQVGSSVTVVFMHALLSSKEYFKPFIPQIGKILEGKNGKNVSMEAWSVDARNHGDSEHVNSHSMDDLVEDMRAFVTFHGLLGKKLVFCGHSMGGKTALRYALKYPNDLSGVISLDASPASYIHNHSNIFKVLKSINLSSCSSRLDVSNQLLKTLSKNDTAFILSNLKLNPLSWRTNNDVLSESESKIHEWIPLESQFHRPILFVGGLQSSRLTSDIYLTNLPQFTDRRLVFVDTGHFVLSSPKCSEFIANFLFDL